MRILGLILAALLGLTAPALAACPGTSSDCPPLSTSQLNLGGAIVSPTGVPLTPPVTMPSGSGLVLTTTDAQGHTAWLPGGSASLPTSAPLIGANSSGAGITVTPSNGLMISGSTLIPTYGTSAGTFAQGNDSRIVGALQSVPIATTSILGGVIPDGMTISINGSGVISSIGGAATSVVVGTTTVGGGSAGSFLQNNSGTLGNVAPTGSGSVVLSTSPTLVTPALGTPSAVVLTNGTGLPIAGMTGLGTGVASALGSAVSGSGGLLGGTSPAIASPALSGTITGTPTASGAWTFSGGLTGTVTGHSTLDLSLSGGTLTGGLNVPSIGAVTPGTGVFSTLNSVSNISLNGTAVIGTNITGGGNSPSMGPAIVLITAVDHSTASQGVRNNQFLTTLTPSVNTTNHWENDFSQVILNGPGQANGEINAFHGYLQVNSGAFFNTGENIEASFFNSGTVNGVGGYSVLYNNASTGTTTSYIGINGGLTNANTSAGSVGTYAFINMNPAILTGGGTNPTNYSFLVNRDVNAGSAILGKMLIGALGTGDAYFEIVGPNTSFSSWAFDVQNSAGLHIILGHDDGTVGFGGAITVASTANITGAMTLGNITGSTQCLHVSTTGLVSGTGSDCGSGGGGGIGTTTDGTTTGTSQTQLQFNSGQITSVAGGVTQWQGVTTLTYTSNTTVALPANAKMVRFIAEGQGGCGGAGASITTPFTGAGGGGGGGAVIKDSGWFPAAQLSGSYSISLGTACTASVGGTTGGNGGNGGVGANAQVAMTGMDTLISYGGGGGAGAVGGAGATATGGGGGAGTLAPGTSTTGATGGTGGGINGQTGGSGTFTAAMTLYGGGTGGAGSASTGAGANGRPSPGGSGGGASGGGCNTGTPAAGGGGFAQNNSSTFAAAGTAGGASGGNGNTGAPSGGIGGLTGGGSGSGGGGGTTTGGTGGNGGLGGGGGGGGGSGCGASATGGNGGVGDGPRVLVEIQ